MALPSNRNDKENARFGLSGTGEVGVRVVGSTTSTSGVDINDTLLEQFRLMTSLLSEIRALTEASLNHLRIITGVEEDEGESF